MEFDPKNASQDPTRNDPKCSCGKGTNPFYVITCPIHGSPKVKERRPRRNKALNEILHNLKINNFQVISRGLARWILIDPEDGHLIFLWKRSSLTSYRGDPLKGLTKNQRFMYQLMKSHGHDCRIL